MPQDGRGTEPVESGSTVRDRWRRAQSYELEFWKRYENQLPDHGGALLPNLPFVLSADLEGKSVLEVGCGPMGVIYFAPGSRRVGVDPLALEYTRSLEFSTRGVHLLASMGEHLPFGDGSFDVVVIGNVLDHVDEPGRTLDEIHRVLRPDGQIILWMHVIPRWLVPLRRILDMVDSGHPHHMTEAEARALFRRTRLEPTDSNTEAPGLAWTSGWKAILANLAMRSLLVKGRAVEHLATADPS